MNNNTINFDETMPPGGSDSGDSSLKSGDKLGQYKVVQLLGRGGMGEVYEVEHTTLRRRYALKLLPADFANRTGALERFKREAEVMANLEHPNIVKVDEFGETDGRYWLRMELANGHNGCVSLQDYADKHDGKVEPDTLAGIFQQILTGLTHAHEHGVIHRDLKPANILIFEDSDGYATFKVADFGLVRMIGEEWLQSRTEQSIRLSMSIGGMQTEVPDGAGSSTRSLIGTYEYMSPEQKRGEEATTASDVYSVGLMMYRLLTGRQLGMKRPSEIVPGLAESWDRLIMKAVDDDPTDRYADFKKMRLAFAAKQKTSTETTKAKPPLHATETQRVAGTATGRAKSKSAAAGIDFSDDTKDLNEIGAEPLQSGDSDAQDSETPWKRIAGGCFLAAYGIVYIFGMQASKGNLDHNDTLITWVLLLPLGLFIAGVAIRVCLFLKNL